MFVLQDPVSGTEHRRTAFAANFLEPSETAETRSRIVDDDYGK